MNDIYAVRTPRTSRLVEAITLVQKRLKPPNEVAQLIYERMSCIKELAQSILTGVDCVKLDRTSIMETGEVRLPFDTTAFEYETLFKDGYPVHHVAVFQCVDNIYHFTGFQEFPSKRWMVTGGKINLEMNTVQVFEQELFRWLNEWADDPGRAENIAYQVESARFGMGTAKAVCVLLDSGVAEARAERPPRWHRKLMKRDGIPELKDFHKLYIRKQRSTYEPRGGTHASPRAHFRRGHWRHLSEIKKTWVRWTMVGDLDLGFIDKAYVVK